jgi:hypothetical protein
MRPRRPMPHEASYLQMGVTLYQACYMAMPIVLFTTACLTTRDY